MTRPTRLVPKRRLHLDLAPDVYETLLAARDQIGADSLSETVRRAITFYSAMHTIAAKNSGMLTVYQHGEHVTVMMT